MSEMIDGVAVLETAVRYGLKGCFLNDKKHTITIEMDEKSYSI